MRRQTEGADVRQDEELARALQAQEFHRQRHTVAAAPGHTERQLRRDEHLRMALEANPEAFVKVHMLYVSYMKTRHANKHTDDKTNEQTDKQSR